MRPISDKSDTPDKKDGSQRPETSSESRVDSKVPEDSKMNESRDEKLARIRLAIESGQYDSEELLENSLARLLQKLEKEKNSQNSQH
jgi:anti-sigma28 factor (negative regulator of flagellin synthesis)